MTHDQLRNPLSRSCRARDIERQVLHDELRNAPSRTCGPEAMVLNSMCALSPAEGRGCAGVRPMQAPNRGAMRPHSQRAAGPERTSGSGSSSSHGAGPADANAGPRIFLGKLNKDTNENDVKVRAISWQPCIRLLK